MMTTRKRKKKDEPFIFFFFSFLFSQNTKIKGRSERERERKERKWQRERRDRKASLWKKIITEKKGRTMLEQTKEKESAHTQKKKKQGEGGEPFSKLSLLIFSSSFLSIFLLEVGKNVFYNLHFPPTIFFYAQFSCFVYFFSNILSSVEGKRNAEKSLRRDRREKFFFSFLRILFFLSFVSSSFLFPCLDIFFLKGKVCTIYQRETEREQEEKNDATTIAAATVDAFILIIIFFLRSPLLLHVSSWWLQITIS